MIPLFSTIDAQDFSQLSQALPHGDGFNRGHGHSLLAAKTDAEAIQSYLSEFCQQKLTYRTYLKELERFCLWLIHHRQLPLSALQREDLTNYRFFLSDPFPAELWIGPRRPRLGHDAKPNPNWYPFAKPLADISIKKSITVLDGFFNYLVAHHYLLGNPLAVIHRRQGKKATHSERWLDRDEILSVLNTVEQYGYRNPHEQPKCSKTLFLIQLLFYTGLRLAEVCQHRMGDFKLHEGRWYLHIVGKGDKPRKIAIPDDFLPCLQAFRRQLGWPAFPAYQEPYPLVPGPNHRPLSEDSIYGMLKWAFSLTADAYQQVAESRADEDTIRDAAYHASRLRLASTHWLRHSYGTYLVKAGVAIEKVQKLMGHSDISTTMLYVHMAQHDLHDAAQNLSLTSPDE